MHYLNQPEVGVGAGQGREFSATASRVRRVSARTGEQIGGKKLVGSMEVSGGGLVWMGGLEGTTFAVLSPAKRVHEGVYKVQNGVFS
jgi:hypothetical protein